MIRDKIKNLIKKAIEAEFGQIEMPEVDIEKPENEDFGDYSVNIAMKLAKVLREDPRVVAKRLISRFQILDSRFFSEAKIAEPGFINFYLNQEYLQKQVGEILKKGEKLGDLNTGKKQKVHPVKSAEGGAKQFNRVNVEFISANPTGPLTLGNGRGGFCGDVIANVLAKAGYEVTREYYINDVGQQIKRLGEGGYDKVKEVGEIREKIKEKEPYKLGEKTAKEIFEKLIKPEVKKDMKINFDVWFSEKSLYGKKEVDKVLEELKDKKLAYEKEGALWFKSTKFGDDKDRVLVKADGEKTYLASDAAYLKNKFERGFDKLIYIWGADHHGYIKRLKAAAQALGYEPDRVEVIIMQLVRLMEGGKEVRMSKRTGTFIALQELISEVGLDAARFFFLMYSANSHMNFDLSLAKERSKKNPVFYVQYAYARIHSILAKSKILNPKSETNPKSKIQNSKLKLLVHPSELELIKQLVRLPEIVEDTAKDYQVQRLPNYALELVTAFHKFYEECRVLPMTPKQPAPLRGARPGSKARCGASKQKTQARLGLVQAVKIVLKNILDLMGISAPERM